MKLLAFIAFLGISIFLIADTIVLIDYWSLMKVSHRWSLVGEIIACIIGIGACVYLEFIHKEKKG
jgi:hypothetical protein